VSGYASHGEVQEVVKDTLVMEGRDPKDYYLARIINDAFYHRGPGWGWGAHDAQTWHAAVARHQRPQRQRTRANEGATNPAEQ
jgi:hypothetical protein